MDKVAANLHRVQAVRRALQPDKLAQVARRAVAQPAGRRVVQAAVQLFRLRHNIVPAGVVVKKTK